MAPGPESFEEAADIERITPTRLENILQPRKAPGVNLDAEFTFTNHGIRIVLPVQMVDDERRIFVAFLSCGNTDEEAIFAVHLRQGSDMQYSRVPDYYDRPRLLEIPTEAIKASSSVADGYIYVGPLITEPWSQFLNAVIRAEDIIEFCKQYGFTIVNDDVLYQSYYTVNTEAEPGDGDNERYLILENETLDVQLLLVTTLDASLADRQQKDCVVITVHTLGPNGVLPYQPGQSPEEIYQTYQESDLSSQRVSHFAEVILPDGRQIAFCMINVDEPRWKNIDGPNYGTWRLFVTMLD